MATAKKKTKRKAKKAASQNSQNILKKVKGLIARTGSSAMEEARTSAFLACKLIREHELEVFDPRAKPARQTRQTHPARSNGPVKRGAWWQSVVDDFVDSAGDAVRVDPFAPSNVPQDSDIYFSTARFAGKCKRCRGAVRVGERVAYIRTGPKKGVYHATECANQAQ